MAEFDYSEACSKIAHMTEGLSAREITNLALDWQMSTYASVDGVFTKERMMERAEAAVQHKKHKVFNENSYLYKTLLHICRSLRLIQNFP